MNPASPQETLFRAIEATRSAAPFAPLLAQEYPLKRSDFTLIEETRLLADQSTSESGFKNAKIRTKQSDSRVKEGRERVLAREIPKSIAIASAAIAEAAIEVEVEPPMRNPLESLTRTARPQDRDFSSQAASVLILKELTGGADQRDDCSYAKVDETWFGESRIFGAAKNSEASLCAFLATSIGFGTKCSKIEEHRCFQMFQTRKEI